MAADTDRAKTIRLIEHEDDEKDKVKCIDVFKKTIKFLFSTASLFILNTVYIVIGGWIFQHLEQHNELMSCFSGARNYKRAENASLQLLLDIAERAAAGEMQVKESRVGIQNDYSKVLKSFSLSVLNINHNVTKNCTMLGEPGGPAYDWSFEGSVVFAMTVTTTIGYGVLAPKTLWGRLVCIIYSLMGIPLMIMCLAFVGEMMAHIFRFIYSVICCCGCCRTRNRPPELLEKQLTNNMQLYRLDANGKPIMYTDYDDDYDDYDDEEEEIVTVPLTISIITLIVFTTFGAALFGVWETWDFVKATYFCFVTYSTIGFGDVVPGFDSLDNSRSTVKLLAAGIYQVVGMATLSMCFQLMQDEMIAKFNWLKDKCTKKQNKDKDEQPDKSNNENKKYC